MHWWAAAVWAAVSVPAALLIARAIRQGGPRMPAIAWNLHVEAGSWEPQYITLTDPETGQPLDLTAPGYVVRGVVASRPDGSGTVLADLDDGTVWRRTTDGRIYFEPPNAVTSAWGWRHGYHQTELAHPSGKTVRIAAGRVTVSPELVSG